MSEILKKYCERQIAQFPNHVSVKFSLRHGRTFIMKCCTSEQRANSGNNFSHTTFG